MRIAFLTEGDPHDVRAFSGLTISIWKALAEECAALELIGNLRTVWRFPLHVRAFLMRQILGQRFLSGRSPLLLKSYARQIERRLDERRLDAVFSSGTACLAYLGTQLPAAFWTDATFAALVALYPDFRNLHPGSLAQGHAMESAAYRRSSACFFSSDWAAKSALSDYGVPQSKVHVVPFGPNLESGLQDEEIEAAIGNRESATPKLLFLGIDWERKGGNFALAVTRSLRERGLPAELTIVGTTPNIPEPMRAFTHVVGFVSKQSEAGREKLRRIMLQNHFLILPSKAECCPVAFAEASAFGIPSIGFHAGGSATAVRDGVNGFLFPGDASPEAVATSIENLVADRRGYRELSRSAYNEYRTRLNWQTSAQTVMSILQRVLDDG